MRAAGRKERRDLIEPPAREIVNRTREIGGRGEGQSRLPERTRRAGKGIIKGRDTALKRESHERRAKTKS